MFAALSPARRRLVLAAIGVVVSLLLLIVIAVLRAREPTVVPVSQNVVGPVLLVPGYGGSTTALQVLADALQAQGRDASVVSLEGDGTNDLRLQAEVLDGAVNAALVRTGAASVDVVGYSAGGVIARLWVADLGGGNVARRVLTIGTPHHGTDVAGLASAFAPDSCPTACQQLATDSDLLRELNAHDETPDGPLWVSLWTTSDELVVPPESAALDGALNFSVQSVCGSGAIEHGDLPRNPEVIALTVRELGQALPRLPTASDC